MFIDGLQRGFTLIELIVVISVVGLMLFFTIPNLQGNLLPQSPEDVTRWIIRAEKMLRENAVRHNRRYTLHLDLPTGKIWFSDESMMPGDIEESAAKAKKLSGDIKISEVRFPLKDYTALERAEIRFYPKGYSDKAVIRLSKGYSERYSLHIEPFLPGVRVFKDE